VTQTTLAPPPADAPAGGSRLRRIDWRAYAIYIGFVAVFVLFAIFLADDGFLTATCSTSSARPRSSR
jgi:ribose transport system permease protein